MISVKGFKVPVAEGADLSRKAVVAIPACNEADRIADCLASLAVQHDGRGAPLKSGVFSVLVLANNCSDGTAAAVLALRDLVPYPLEVIEERLGPAQSNAGWARKRAMDLAADRLGGHRRGVIMTTDADSSVGSTWVGNTLAAFDRGVDAVAGYIEAEPRELLTLGPAFLRRGRDEDTYLAAIAELYSLCDPLAHDPWPNHRVSSGASLAVSLAAYRAIGGLPPKPVGEDAALREALLAQGFKIRHAMDVRVTTSCRLEGRAPGGAADTMRFRRDHPDSVCDAEIEPVRKVVQRAAWKRRIRRWHEDPDARRLRELAGRLGLTSERGLALARDHAAFEPLWRAIEAESPRLQRGAPLRPCDLPLQIDRARTVLRRIGRSVPFSIPAAMPISLDPRPLGSMASAVLARGDRPR